MNQLLARSMINNGWVVVSICLLGIFAIYLVKEMLQDGWYSYVRNKAAIALLIYFTGEAGARLWTVVLLSKYIDKENAQSVERWYPLALGFACLSLVGAICCVRTFAPPSWGHRGWLFVVAAVGVTMLVTVYT